MSFTALIGLGSNVGDRAGHLDFAAGALRRIEGVKVQAVSRYHETPPVGGPPGQRAFLNAAASLETMLHPRRLLEHLHAIEHTAGRVRTTHWGERTLDLDLLLLGNKVIDTPALRLPHPRMALRRFVLAPLSEIAPEAIDPITGRSIRGLLANLDRRPSYVALAGGSWIDPVEIGPLNWELMDMSRFFRRDDQGLASRLREAISGMGLEDRTGELPSAMLDRPNAFPDSGTGRKLMAQVASRLDSGALSVSIPAETWLVTSFWFDTVFLSLDSLKSSRPRGTLFREQFLELRSKVLPPTFVVASPEDRRRYGIHDPRYAWFSPVGWDTPILEVPDTDPVAALALVRDACAATRAG